MVHRAEVPEAPERPDMPLDTPLVIRRGAGLRTMETDFGDRPAFGVHVYVAGDDGVIYLGHINIFWQAALAQLAEGIGESDDILMATQVVKNGRRYEFAGLGNPDLVDSLYDATEKLMADDDKSDAPEDAPF